MLEIFLPAELVYWMRGRPASGVRKTAKETPAIADIKDEIINECE
jgi:hypothetical protein